MNRAALFEQLEQAEARVAYDERRIARQKNLIRDLSRDSPAGINAQEYLHVFEAIQAEQIARRDRLAHELRITNPQ